MHDAYPALVLNADFQPISQFPLELMDWHRAVKAVVAGTHAVVAEYDRTVRSPSIEMRLPSVIATLKYIKPPARVSFTRHNVFLRDHFRCQYCSAEKTTLTFDHVTPRSLGGTTCWENIVAACEPCNFRKGNKTCAQAHMHPMQKPAEPTTHQLRAAQKLFPPRYLHETWRDYLYWTAELEA